MVLVERLNGYHGAEHGHDGCFVRALVEDRIDAGPMFVQVVKVCGGAVYLCIALMLREELCHLIDGGNDVSGRVLLGDNAEVCGGASDVCYWEGFEGCIVDVGLDYFLDVWRDVVKDEV